MTESLLKADPDVEWHVMPRANHVLCYDFGADTMLKEVVRFFKGHLKREDGRDGRI